MPRFIIHGITPDGEEDELTIEEDTLPLIRERAAEEVKARGWTDFWSEEK